MLPSGCWRCQQHVIRTGNAGVGALVRFFPLLLGIVAIEDNRRRPQATMPANTPIGDSRVPTMLMGHEVVFSTALMGIITPRTPPDFRGSDPASLLQPKRPQPTSNLFSNPSFQTIITMQSPPAFVCSGYSYDELPQTPITGDVVKLLPHLQPQPGLVLVCCMRCVRYWGTMRHREGKEWVDFTPAELLGGLRQICYKDPSYAKCNRCAKSGHDCAPVSLLFPCFPHAFRMLLCCFCVWC